MQQLIDCGLPLQAATQLTLWVNADHPAQTQRLQSAGAESTAPALAHDEHESAFVATRPVSAVVKLRESASASSSRPRSSIGMSRALSPAHNPPAAVEEPSTLPQSPRASIASSAPTNIIVRSFRDVEHRAQLLQRAKTSSARIMPLQPLVIPNVHPFLFSARRASSSLSVFAHQVPARLRTQGAFDAVPSSPPRQQASPPFTGTGLAALLGSKADIDSGDGACRSAAVRHAVLTPPLQMMS